MIIRKELVELMGYSQIIGEYTIVPVRIEADDVNFEVEFQAYNKSDTPRVPAGSKKSFHNLWKRCNRYGTPVHRKTNR